jgi:hypothetical protein
MNRADGTTIAIVRAARKGAQSYRFKYRDQLGQWWRLDAHSAYSYPTARTQLSVLACKHRQHANSWQLTCRHAVLSLLREEVGDV